MAAPEPNLETAILLPFRDEVDYLGIPAICNIELELQSPGEGAKTLNQMSINRRVTFTVLGTLLVGQDAFAYIDPGTGSLIIQWLFGMILAGFAVLNIYWARFKAFLAGRSGDNSAGHDVESPADQPEPD